MSQVNRRRFLAGTALVSAALVSTAHAQGTDTPTISLVKSLYAAFGKGEVATIVSATTADVVWESVGRVIQRLPVLRRAQGPGRCAGVFRHRRRRSQLRLLAHEFYAWRQGIRARALRVHGEEDRQVGRVRIGSTFTIADGKVRSFRVQWIRPEPRKRAVGADLAQEGSRSIVIS